jgi:hypothetical protein
MLIIIKERDDYYHIATAIGSYGIIEGVDGKFRAEHYKLFAMDMLVTDIVEYTERRTELGNTDTFEEALQLITAALELPPYISTRIAAGHAKTNQDWLVRYVTCPDIVGYTERRTIHGELVEFEYEYSDDVDTMLSTWYTKMGTVSWLGHANESRREAEFFETHTAEDPHGLQASECHARADALDFMHDIVIGLFGCVEEVYEMASDFMDMRDHDREMGILWDTQKGERSGFLGTPKEKANE